MTTETPTRPTWAGGEPFEVAGDPFAWVENIKDAGFYEVGKAAEILRRDYTGWYLDDDVQDETAVGVVLERVIERTSAEDVVRYHAAILDPYNDDAAMVGLTEHEDRTEAAHSADSAARQYAESERDYRAANNGGFEVAETLRELRELRADLENIIENRPVANAARAEEARMVRRIRALAETRRWRNPQIFDDTFSETFGDDWSDDLLDD